MVVDLSKEWSMFEGDVQELADRSCIPFDRLGPLCLRQFRQTPDVLADRLRDAMLAARETPDA